MPLIHARFDGVERVQAKADAIQGVVQRGMRDPLRQLARLTGVSAAKSSVPYGTDSAAQQLGEKAVAKDIALVYATPSRAWRDIVDQRAAAAFWRALKNGELERAQAILQQYGNELRDVFLQPFDDGVAHKAARDPDTGRVRIEKPAMIVIEGGESGSPLDRYVQSVQENVGFGKGGWADAARRLGGIRGIHEADDDISARWILEKASGLGEVSEGGSDDAPTITISNTVRYASNILAASAQADAISIARGRFERYLFSALQAELRSERLAA